ncbi:serine hydrolase [Candidatus Saccharibacteria bacterium]|nr:serine hydrolase [Candidatus Saccharibacteria bacterium]
MVRNKKITQRLSLLVLAVFFVAQFLALFMVRDTAMAEGDMELVSKYGIGEKRLDEIMEQFRREHGLTAKNFSMSYRTVDGALKYDYMENEFRVAGSTYKLPLNMYYYDLERAGKISPSASIGGTTLEVAHRKSIVDSNNELSEAMYKRLGSYKHYRELIAGYCAQEYPAIFYRRNRINTGYMVCVLGRLYNERANYEELIEYMNKAAVGRFFKKGNDKIAIAHKYGEYDGALNDTGIIWGEHPYVLAVFTSGVRNGENVLSEIVKIMTAYTEIEMTRRQEAGLVAEEQRVKEEIMAEKLNSDVKGVAGQNTTWSAELRNGFMKMSQERKKRVMIVLGLSIGEVMAATMIWRVGLRKEWKWRKLREKLAKKRSLRYNLR